MIEVGEYIRTKLGDIKQITEGFEFIIERHNKSYNYIVKHSKNIIDLIEAGDFVNGYKVTGVMCGYVYVDKVKLNTNLVTTYTDYQIKSIVTSEQFKNIEYIVED